jgi:hypothetical protein
LGCGFGCGLSSTGYGSGAAELDAPKGKDGSGGRDAMAGLDAAGEDDEDDEGGAGHLGLLEGGLSGLNILSGSTVGLSQPSASGRGLLIKSSSSGTSRDRDPMVRAATGSGGVCP